MTFKILNEQLIQEFKESCIISPLEKLNQLKKEELTVDYFQFYNSVSSVYSSKIEGEEIDFDSYFKHRFLHVKFKPDYTQKADDLYAAYEFIEKNQINSRFSAIPNSKFQIPKGSPAIWNLEFVIWNRPLREAVVFSPRYVSLSASGRGSAW